MQKWTAERIKSIQEYREKNNVTLEQAAKDLKFGVGNYYVNKKKFENVAPKAKRPYAFKSKVTKPVTLEMASYSGANKVVILIADRSQVKSILSEVF